MANLELDIRIVPPREKHPAIFRTSLPARDELPSCPGRGWALGPGTATPLQVAVR